jgi:hypothetical protein
VVVGGWHLLHPTGHDEQAASFTPYLDLHFDRVSADRARFVNYWYRNYQFAPAEIIPGYMPHQTERNINVPADGVTRHERSYMPRSEAGRVVSNRAARRTEAL